MRHTPEEKALWDAGEAETEDRIVRVTFSTYPTAARAFGHGRPWKLMVGAGYQRLEVLVNGDVVGFWEDEYANQREMKPEPVSGTRVRLGSKESLVHGASLEERVAQLEKHVEELRAGQS